MDEQIVFGDRMIAVRFPERTMVVPPGLSISLPPVENLKVAIEGALKTPLDFPPLRELAKPGWKVTIAFDDPTVPCFAPGEKVPAPSGRSWVQAARYRAWKFRSGLRKTGQPLRR